MSKSAFLGVVAAVSLIGAAKADPVDLVGLCRRQRLYRRAGADLRAARQHLSEDANVLMAWYSGWYNGLGHKHYMDYKKGRELEHLVIEYCKAHQDEKIIHAIAVNLKDMRAEGLMQEK